MALVNLTSYLASLRQTPEMLGLCHPSATNLAGRWHDQWMRSVPAATVPTAAAVPTNATQGGLRQQSGGAGTLAVMGGTLRLSYPGQIIICDRLSHQGGLSGAVAGAQTTNLPTAALTRYTDGVGVMAGLTVYTQIGTTATTVTVSYTDQEGYSSQASTAVAFGGTGFREAGRIIMVPLLAGDSGVRSVESVALAATTGTAGAFGVTLFRPLMVWSVVSPEGQVDQNLFSGTVCGLLPEVVDGACLFLLASNMTTAGGIGGSVIVKEH